MTRGARHGRSGRSGLVAAAAWMLVMPMTCFAQWRVVDEKGNEHLAEIGRRVGAGDVNKALQQLRDQQRLAQHRASEHTGEAAAPVEVLDPERPSAVVEFGLAERCPAVAGPVDGRAGRQQALCEEMVRTELARYRYSVRMYEVTQVRNKRLAEIEGERAAILEDQPGKLQDNSNKLLVLLSRMQIDRQQHQTYMDAYEARLRYLSAARDTLAAQAMDGDRSAAATTIAIGSLGALALALEGVQTERHDWRQYRRR